LKKWLRGQRHFISIFFCLAFIHACQANESTLNPFLNSIKNSLQHSTSTQTAIVKIIGVQNAEAQIFLNKKTIVGYPLDEDLKPLTKAASKQISILLLDAKNYSNVRTRCLNNMMNGIRFSKGNKVVEVIVSLPCNQIIIALNDSNNITKWGGTLTNTASLKITNLLLTSNRH